MGVVVVMTVHKLTAGDGYTYLTRQVASADQKRTAGQSLSDYYTAQGNPPGTWMGGGAETLGVAGTVVSEEQMRALFGEGAHPDRDAMVAAGASEGSTRLGRPYLTFKPRTSAGDVVTERAAGFEAENGRPPSPTEFKKLQGDANPTSPSCRRRVRPGLHPG